MTHYTRLALLIVRTLNQLRTSLDEISAKGGQSVDLIFTNLLLTTIYQSLSYFIKKKVVIAPSLLLPLTRSKTGIRFPKKFEYAEIKYMHAKWQEMSSKLPGSSLSCEQWLVNFPVLHDSVSIDFWTSRNFQTCLRSKPNFFRKCKNPKKYFCYLTMRVLVLFWCLKYRWQVFSWILNADPCKNKKNPCLECN